MTKAERTKQLIIDKSAPLFNAKGVAGTSLSDILEATNLAKGSLYVHFENKEAIAHAVVDDYVVKKRGFLDATLNGSGSARDQLFTYLDLVLHPVNSLFVGGCPFLNFGMECDDTDQIIRQKVNNIVELVQKRVAETIKTGIDTGEFDANWDPKLTALKFYAMVQGAVMISRISGDKSTKKVIAQFLKEEVNSHVT
ncbi:MAG: TetR/AcrR family transcriptional regulator [Bacteroidota bacterium]